MEEGTRFFDDDERFARYQAGRHRADGPNETLETPVFLQLLGEVKDRRILDLGCGDGLFGRELLAAGCQSYLGLEASRRMAQLARRNLQETGGRVVQETIEDWHYPAATFDLVISRLALHYVADLGATFRKVYHTLRENGRFVFSMVHPVITSSDKSRAGSGLRQDWIVDNYFSTGARRVRFMGEYVRQYHRTLEEIFGSLQQAGFRVEALRESRPRRERFADVALYERRKRIPLFLFLASSKND